MRPANPEALKDFWLGRFLRLVLTHRPGLRFRLDYTLIDTLYAKHADPIAAARIYLQQST